MKNIIRRMIALAGVLAMLPAGFTAAEMAGETPAPEPVRVSDRELGELEIRIDGPDESMPMTVKYSEFRDGKFVLEGLAPGTYTVTEVRPEKLLEGYTLVVEDSVQRVTVEVTDGETGTGTLRNVYEAYVQSTPEPDGNGTVSVPVKKIWEDDNNRDGNRPERVVVNLLGNGKTVGQAVLSEANGWSWRFTNLPASTEGREIAYTVTEEKVPMYTPVVDGFTVTNIYTPETTSASVMKIWLDRNDEKKLRPDSIRCTLSNGQSVVLNEGNNWSATVDGLPKMLNGQPVEYTWTEHESAGYERVSADVIGDTTIFTNRLIEREGKVPEGKKEPSKKRGDSYEIIDDYGTPLGVEMTINHVGDCFD